MNNNLPFVDALILTIMPNETEEIVEKPMAEKTQETAAFLTPEAIVMFIIAGIFDSIGLILFVLSFFIIGIPPSFVLDVTGFTFFLSWMLLRMLILGGTSAEGFKKLIGKTGKSLIKIAKRLGLTTLAELIPFLGDVCPSWVLLVYFEIKSGIKK